MERRKNQYLGSYEDRLPFRMQLLLSASSSCTWDRSETSAKGLNQILCQRGCDYKEESETLDGESSTDSRVRVLERTRCIEKLAMLCKACGKPGMGACSWRSSVSEAEARALQPED